MFKENQEGQTHSYGDGCGEPAHNPKKLEIKKISNLTKKEKKELIKMAENEIREYEKFIYKLKQELQ